MLRVALAIVLGALTFTASAEPASETYSYRFYQTAKPLELKRDRVAYFGASVDGLADRLRANGSSVDRIEPTAIRDLSIVVSGDNIADLRATLGRLTAALGKDEFISPVFRDDFGGDLIPTRSVLLGIGDGMTDARVREMVDRLAPGSTVSKPWRSFTTMYRVDTSLPHGLDVLEAANRLAMMEGVEFAEPDMMFTGFGMHTPNDPGYIQCWGHENLGQFGGLPDMDMDTNEAWVVTTGSPGVRVLVIDTGVDMNHPDLTLYHSGFDLTSDGGDGNPLNQFDNHGTPVAGCVSATIDNGLGTVGVAPGCEVIPARTFIAINSNGNWSSCNSWTVSALQVALDEGALVTNNSNRYGNVSSAINNAYSFTRNLGVVHFASAGNESAGASTFPASSPFVNAVAALDQAGEPTDFTNSDLDMAFSAPGIDVYTTDRTGSAGWSSGDYTFAYGTSFASPYVAGVAALIRSLDPTMTPAEVVQLMQATAVDLGAPGHDRFFGHGLVNAGAAVREAFICRGDCAVSGEIDFNDLLCVLFRFGQSNPNDETDCDGSGEVDFNDLICTLFLFGPCF